MQPDLAVARLLIRGVGCDPGGGRGQVLILPEVLDKALEILLF